MKTTTDGDDYELISKAEHAALVAVEEVMERSLRIFQTRSPDPLTPHDCGCIARDMNTVLANLAAFRGNK